MLPNEGLGLCRGRDLCSAQKRNINHRPLTISLSDPSVRQHTPCVETPGHGHAPGVLLSIPRKAARLAQGGIVDRVGIE
jgi:hypothetical protein